MHPVSKVKTRARSLTIDEWIIASVTAALVFPEYIFAVILCAVAIFALVHPARRSAMMDQPGFLVAMLMLPAMLLPVILSGNLTGLVFGAVIWLAIVFCMYASSVITHRFAGNLLDLLLVISIIASAVGLFDRLFIGTMVDGVMRTSSIFSNANHYGYCIELFSIIALCRYVKKGKPIYLVVLVINLASNLLCDCRTAWLAIIAALCTLMLFKVRGRWVLFAVMGACMAGGVILIFVLPQISPRLSITSIMSSFYRRSDMWKTAVDWIGDNPLFGYGAGSYEMLSIQHGVRVLKHAHNLILNLLLDFGLIGTVCFGIFAWQTLVPAFKKSYVKKYSYLSAMILSALVATMVHGITDVPIFGVSTSYVFVLMMATSSVKRNEISYEYGMVRARGKSKVTERHAAASVPGKPVLPGKKAYTVAEMSGCTASNDNNPVA